MNLRRAIINAMRQDDLRAVCRILKFDGVDRRRRNDMAPSYHDSRSATTELLVEASGRGAEQSNLQMRSRSIKCGTRDVD